MTNLTANQTKLLDYLCDLNDEFDARDYSHYGDRADEVRAADLAFMDKVGAALKRDGRIWPAGKVAK